MDPMHSHNFQLYQQQKHEFKLNMTLMYSYVGVFADMLTSAENITGKSNEFSSAVLPWKHRSENHQTSKNIVPHESSLTSVDQLQNLISKQQQQWMEKNLVEYTPIQLVVYLDSNFDRKASVIISNNIKCEKEITVSGLLPNDIIPRDARLCIQAYLTTTNQYGAKCWSEGGITSFSIHDLLKEHHKASSDNKKAFIKSGLHIHTTPSNILKGKVGLLMNHISFDSHVPSSSQRQPSQNRMITTSKLGYNIKFTKMTKTMNTKTNREYIMKIIGGYLQRFSVEQSLFKDNYIKGTDKIKCPLDPSEITVANSQICLPFAAYTMYEVPKVSTGYWYNALEILSNREGFENSSQFKDYFFKKASLERKASLSMALICQYTHLMEYVSDRTANKSGMKINIEMFGDALRTLCGDCEDEGLSIGQMFDAFVQHKSSQFKKKIDHRYYTPDGSAILMEMHQILHQYIPFICIEGVTTSHAQNQHDIKTRSVTGAHAAIKAIPKDYLADCIARWNPTHPIIKDLIVHPKYSRTQDEYTESVLPVLIGEGTGMLNPGGDPDPSPRSRNLVYHCRALQVCKKPLMPLKGSSPFYVAILFGSTNRFLFSHRIGSFHFCKKINSNSRRGGSNNRRGMSIESDYTYGVLFKSLIQKDPNLMIIPYGFSNKTKATSKNGHSCEFTQQEISVMHHVSKTRVPPMPIISPQESTIHHQQQQHGSQNTINDMMLSSIDYNVNHVVLSSIESSTTNISYNHRINYNGDYKEYKKRLHNIHVYTTDVHITPQFGAEVTAYIKKNKYAIKGFHYALERHSNKVSYWRLTFECDEHV